MNLEGQWKLSSWYKVFRDGSSEPWDPEGVSGYLVYAPDGTMAVSIYSRDGVRLHTAYCGSYELHESEVRHYPTTGSSPFGIEDVKKRYIEVKDSGLEMHSDWIGADQQAFQHKLVWRSNVRH